MIDNINKIKNAVTSEAADCAKRKDAEGGVELITTLVTGLALAISSQSRGNRVLANDFVEAASNLLMSEVVRFQPLSEFMETGTGKGA